MLRKICLLVSGLFAVLAFAGATIVEVDAQQVPGNCQVFGACLYPSALVLDTQAHATLGYPGAYPLSIASPLNVTSWNEYRLSAYSGCGIADSTAAINSLIAIASGATTAGSSTVAGIGTKIIFDCNVTISNALTIPSGASNITFVGNGNVINVAAGYNGDVFAETASGASQANAGLTFDDFSFNFQSPTNTVVPRTAGAIFRIPACVACTFNNIAWSGEPYDGFVISNATTVATAQDVVISNVHTLINGYLADKAFQFPGNAGSIWIHDVNVTCDINRSGTEGMVWNDSALGSYTNQDVWYIEHVDFEQCGKGYDINMAHSSWGDAFFSNDIVDATRGGSNWSFVASGSSGGASGTPCSPNPSTNVGANCGLITRVKFVNPWAAGYSVAPAYNFSQSGYGSVYDVEMTGGYAQNPQTNSGVSYGMSIGTGVTGVIVNGTQFYHNVNGAIYDDGTDTSVIGAHIGTTISGYTGTQTFGIFADSTEIGGNYQGNDMRGNTTYAFQTSAGAGGAQGTAITFAGNNVGGYANPYNVNAGSYANISNNVGNAQSFNGISCTLMDAYSQSGAVGCLDNAGDFAVKGAVSVGSSGPSWSSGAFTVGGACSPNGSMKSYTAGVSGTTLGVCVSSVWVDIK